MEKILMVGPVPPPYGGIASVVEDLVSSALSLEYDFEIFVRTAWFPPEARGRLGRNVFRLKRFGRFFRKVHSGSYGLVHIHSADPAFTGTVIFMLLSRLARVPVILHMHGTEWDDFFTTASPLRKELIRCGLFLANRIVVLYSAWEAQIRRLLPSSDVRTIRNFVRRIEPPDVSSVETLKHELGLGPDCFVVVTIGSVGWRKGSFEILKAVSQVVSGENSVRFVLVGGEEHPGDMERLQNIVEAEKLDDWVILAGEVEREQVSVFLGIADLFLLPSFIEGMPISIIEAMQLEVPIIATRVNAIPELVEDDVSALLIDPGSPAQIVDAVLRLKEDGNLRRRLSAAAKTVYDDKFEISKGLDEIRSLYKSI